MDGKSRVELPPAVGDRYEVYVNGVLQQPGKDFDRIGGTLVFRRELAREGRLGPVRWLSMLLGIAESFTATFYGPSWAPAVSFGILLLTLAFRPAGLLGR